VSRYYGDDAAARAAAEFDRVFRDRELPEEVPPLSLPPEELKQGRIWIVKLLRLSGCAASNSQARRLVEQGGVSLGPSADRLAVVRDANADVPVTEGTILKVGRRRFFRLCV